MSTEMDYLDDLDPDDPRATSEQIANKLRAAILTGKLQPAEKLPSQPSLSDRFGVARETVKSALQTLRSERLIVTRQGSGSYVRAQVERPVGLRPHMDAAFNGSHVAVDFAGFSGETLYNTLIEPLDKIRAGRLTPESLKIRILMCDTSQPMTLPRRVEETHADAAIRQRSDRIARRAVDGISDTVHELADLGLVKSTSVEVRVHGLTPAFKLYILNDEEVFYGLYPVTKHSIRVDGESTEVYDLLGKDAALFHFSTSEDAETTNGPQFVQEARTWFNALWTTIAHEYTA